MINEWLREVRLGLAPSLTLAALHEARSSGYRQAVLHLTPMAWKIINLWIGGQCP
jgi:hypothetical protein